MLYNVDVHCILIGTWGPSDPKSLGLQTRLHFLLKFKFSCYNSPQARLPKTMAPPPQMSPVILEHSKGGLMSVLARVCPPEPASRSGSPATCSACASGCLEGLPPPAETTRLVQRRRKGDVLPGTGHTADRRSGVHGASFQPGAGLFLTSATGFSPCTGISAVSLPSVNTGWRAMLILQTGSRHVLNQKVP